ncbi:MAG: FliH/SctL family protein [Oligoflexia bacterium]
MAGQGPGRFRFVQGEVLSEGEPGVSHQVVDYEPPHERKISTYQPQRIIKPGTGDYRFTRQKFGPIAISDTPDLHGSQKDGRFVLSHLSREPLSIHAEEKRAFDERVRAEVEILSRQAVEAGREEGIRLGQEEGRKAAREEASAEIQDRLSSLCSMIDSAEAHRARLLEQQERFFLELILKIAKKVCLKELATDEAYVGRLLHAILEKSGARENIRIKISQEDAELLAQLRNDLVQKWGELKNVMIEPSAQVPSGGCEFETDLASYSATLDSQLEAIEQTLLDAPTQATASGAGA